MALAEVECKEYWSLLSQPKEYLDWALRHDSLSVVKCSVPQRLLPRGVLAIDVHDVRVSPFILTKNSKKKRKVPDDFIYDNNEDIRRIVARGNAVVQIRTASGQTQYDFALQGMKKFTGKSDFDDDDRAPEAGNNDEKEGEADAEGEQEKSDEQQVEASNNNNNNNNKKEEVWQKYFLADLSAAQSFIWTEKANGEAAHLAVVKIQEQIFYILGSKNVHVMVRADGENDLDEYAGARDRFSVAREIARAVFILKRAKPEGFAALEQYLLESRLTANFELLQPTSEHVVYYALAEPQLRFFAFSGASCTDTVCVRPLASLRQMSEWELPCVNFTHHLIGTLNDAVRAERDSLFSEGAVAYFVDGEERVIGLWKLKSKWYILIRAIREKVRRNASFAKIQKRIGEIDSWLHLEAEEKELWETRARVFSEWIVQNNAQEDLQAFFARCWARCFAEPANAHLAPAPVNN